MTDNIWGFIQILKSQSDLDEEVRKIVGFVKAQRENIRNKAYSPDMTEQIILRSMGVVLSFVVRQYITPMANRLFDLEVGNTQALRDLSNRVNTLEYDNEQLLKRIKQLEAHTGANCS